MVVPCQKNLGNNQLDHRPDEQAAHVPQQTHHNQRFSAGIRWLEAAQSRYVYCKFPLYRCRVEHEIIKGRDHK